MKITETDTQIYAITKTTGSKTVTILSNQEEVDNDFEAMADGLSGIDAAKDDIAHPENWYIEDQANNVSIYVSLLPQDEVYRAYMAIRESKNITDPDIDQYYHYLGEGKYYFSQRDYLTGEWIDDTIDLTKYGFDDIVKVCEGYGYDKDQVWEWLAKGDTALIAKCIFEMGV